MSSYAKITKHPTTGEYHLARWIDDYFAPHFYGVKFPDDDKVYPANFVQERQINDFWADDVVDAFCDFHNGDYCLVSTLYSTESAYIVI